MCQIEFDLKPFDVISFPHLH